jgi:sterol desaturase/sphingolipid hydroxylase (fatty acid hydroxylase superfamily)
MSQEVKLQRGMRLFDHPVLDWMSRVNPLLPGIVWGLVVAAFIAYGLADGVAWRNAIWLLAAGYVLWNFAEYVLHRAIFHWRPRGKRMRRIYYYVHEHHHRYQEWDRLLAPPLMSLPIFVLVLAALYLTIAMPFGLGPMSIVFGGFGIGYLIYDYTHLYIHFAKPKTRLGRFLRKCHLQHHFARPDRWFGISCPWIDYLMGTHVARGEEASAKAWKEHEEDGYTFDELPLKVQEFERFQQHRCSDAGPSRVASH